MSIFSHMKLQGEMEIKVCASRNDLLKRKSPEWRGNGADLRLTESAPIACAVTRTPGVFDIKPLVVCASSICRRVRVVRLFRGAASVNR